jgi:putative spermidine/putrescine transport system ATP-binding protein
LVVWRTRQNASLQNSVKTDTYGTILARSVDLAAVCKSFGRQRAVDDLSLSIEPGEFVTLLGPSGSGKSTTLMLIAGFEHPELGEIRIGDTRVNELPAHRRNLGVVFQHYALFPHLSVAENVAFPLVERGWRQSQIAERVGRVLAQVHLQGFEARLPRQLSGGQQQRVALARALAFQPGVLLMDEPLSALDKHLREEMQVELKALQRALGVTVVFVTHDQTEALALSDRIAVMADGRLQQVGAPSEIYERPQNAFVASFLGETNVIDADVLMHEAGGAVLRTAWGTLRIATQPALGSSLTVAIRPEKLRVEPTRGGSAVVAQATYLGEAQRLLLRQGDASLIAKRLLSAGDRPLSEGEPVAVHLPPQHLHPLKT